MSLREPDPAFDDFVAAYSPHLLRLAYRLTLDAHLAEDLLQEALWRVAKHWSRAKESPRAYADRTLVNLAADRSRSRRRRPIEVRLDTIDRAAASTGDHVEDRELLISSLRQLPPRQRAVLVLRYWEDMSVEQTALLLGCTTGNVKSTASRGLERLRAVLDTEGVHR